MKCPGIYCGRTILENGSWSDCGACFRGFRANSSSYCIPCRDKPVFYDWLYLGFMTLLPLVLHWSCIDNTRPFRGRLSQSAILLHTCAIVEISLAALATVYLVEPFGELDIYSCNVQSLSDWYTLFLNPRPNYAATLHCTQEAVYPLHTMVFIFYGLALLIMLLIRPLIIQLFLSKTGGITIYASLYFFPILALLHAIFGGLIYYTFPYIIIVLSVISNAAHFAFKIDQKVGSLITTTIFDVRNVMIVLSHWAAHAFGIISLTQLTRPAVHLPLLALVPLPAVFYIATARFTDPHKLHSD